MPDKMPDGGNQRTAAKDPKPTVTVKPKKNSSFPPVQRPPGKV